MRFPYQKFIIGSYDPQKPLTPRPFIPVYLHRDGQRTRSAYFALLDSGADRVIFPADLAQEVGLTEIETGVLEAAVGIAHQKADVYYHALGLQLMGDPKILATEIGFSRDVYLPLLGRSFFRHFKRVTFDEEGEEVDLKP